MIVRPRHRPNRYGRYVFFRLFFVFFLPIKACTRGIECVRVIIIKFLSVSFFLPNPIVSE